MNFGITEPLILASASPRRANLLDLIGIPYDVQVSGIDESLPGVTEPAELARTLALRKAQSVASRQIESGRLVLGADSIVVVDERILGKPADEMDAESMLRQILGRQHRVITGFALVETGSSREVTGHETTKVHMRSANEDEVDQYLATGESLDKAGAYGAQGFGAGFMERVDGCFYNVVGLPLARLITEIRAFRISR